MNDKEFMIITCKLNDKICKDYDCVSCAVAEIERNKQYKSSFQFDNDWLLNGKIFKRNARYTVMKITLDDIPHVMQSMHIHSLNYYTEPPNGIEFNYPEWITTMKVLKLNEPQYYLHEKDKALFVIYAYDLVFGVAPRMGVD